VFVKIPIRSPVNNRLCHVIGLISWADTEGSPVSSLNYNRHRDPDRHQNLISCDCCC